MIRLRFIAAIIALVGLVGCGGGDDDRLADLASQVTHEQAQQNQRLADASKAIAQGSKQLVDADSAARRDVIKLQQDLRQDQVEIGHQRDALEAERKAIAWERSTDSAIGSGLVVLGVILACLAPLVLAGIVLLGLWKEPTKEEEGQILVEELANTYIAQQVPDQSAIRAEANAPPNLPPPQDEGQDQD